jgi:hypothetical protein
MIVVRGPAQVYEAPASTAPPQPAWRAGARRAWELSQPVLALGITALVLALEDGALLPKDADPLLMTAVTALVVLLKAYAKAARERDRARYDAYRGGLRRLAEATPDADDAGEDGAGHGAGGRA